MHHSAACEDPLWRLSVAQQIAVWSCEQWMTTIGAPLQTWALCVVLVMSRAPARGGPMRVAHMEHSVQDGSDGPAAAAALASARGACRRRPPGRPGGPPSSRTPGLSGRPAGERRPRHSEGLGACPGPWPKAEAGAKVGFVLRSWAPGERSSLAKSRSGSMFPVRMGSKHGRCRAETT